MSKQTQETIGLITRTVVGIVTVINTLLVMNGLPHLEIGDDVVTNFVNSGLMIVVSIWLYWKNNNVTKPAKKSQTVLDALKSGDSVEVTIDGVREKL